MHLFPGAISKCVLAASMVFLAGCATVTPEQTDMARSKLAEAAKKTETIHVYVVDGYYETGGEGMRPVDLDITAFGAQTEAAFRDKFKETQWP